MTPKQPPRIATWMLKHFGSGPCVENLLGDLAEQYQEDNSASRYWRQSLKAIPVSFIRDIRAHTWSTAKGLVTGWILWLVVAVVIFPIVQYNPNADPSRPHPSLDLVTPGPIVAPMVLTTLPAWGSQVKGPWRIPAAFLFAMVLPIIAGTIAGWLAARCQVRAQLNPITLRFEPVHRDRRASVILLFAGSVLFVNLLGLAFWPSGPTPFLGSLFAVNAAASVLGILLGGGLLQERPSVTSN